MPIAYGDESFREHRQHGFYVLASVIFEAEVADDAREVLLGLRGKHRKLHWYEMEPYEQHRIIKHLADLDGLHVVVTGAPVPLQKQERARAKCLTQLVHELHGFGVDLLVLEARSAELNRRDVSTAAAARRSFLPKEAQFRVDHCPGPLEPMLWAADVVAGACRAAYLGHSEFHDMLADRVYDIEIDTGCRP
ncbi:hypothetical protein ABT337_31230 [Saccharopolyspora hirsuta]|uniref:DUF3800 domain-containing protein n=1 Tax=Saccharopolyspora hirsuta TaxID=1837 RepID=A0A5M7B9I0_SACHI|nr:hypothetical protein [Saccharopolyspora hirsuta]KAA5825350.1 hypothetical protein F1721_33465 [Saccharopolyspora hirsuta]